MARSPAARLVGHAALHRPLWTTVLLFAVITETVLTLLLPAALAAAVDAVLAGTAGDALTRFALLLACALTAELIRQLAAPRCLAATTGWLRRRLLRHLLALGPSRTAGHTCGDLVGRLVSNAPAAAAGVPALFGAAARVATATGAMVLLGLIDPRLLLVLLAGLPVAVVILRLFVRDVTSLVLGYQRTQGDLAARLLDALDGIRTIRACGSIVVEVERVLAPLHRLAQLGSALWRSQRRALWRSAPLVPILHTAVLAVAGYGVLAGRLTPGQLLAVAAYTSLALAVLGNAEMFVALARARAGATRLAEVLDAPVPPSGLRPLPPGAGRLEFRAVTVAPGAEPVLKNLNLVVPAGSAVAVVGSSGAGKSTLADLAGRLRDPDAGEVLLDGIPLGQLAEPLLRDAVSYAFDSPHLFGHTVADAIAFGSDPLPRQRIDDAARTAHADQFIRRLPNGYDTALADTPLSGGESQRLGLARAFARQPRLLVLDDATSSLDTVTEEQVSAALVRAMPGTTRLVVAHRTATAARCDLVAWLDNGTIRALAPHHELTGDPGYRALFNSTAEGQPWLGG